MHRSKMVGLERQGLSGSAGWCFSLSREPLIQTTSHSTLHFLGSSAIHPLSVKSIGWTAIKIIKGQANRKTESPCIYSKMPHVGSHMHLHRHTYALRNTRFEGFLWTHQSHYKYAGVYIHFMTLPAPHSQLTVRVEQKTVLLFFWLTSRSFSLWTFPRLTNTSIIDVQSYSSSLIFATVWVGIWLVYEK